MINDSDNGVRPVKLPEESTNDIESQARTQSSSGLFERLTGVNLRTLFREKKEEAARKLEEDEASQMLSEKEEFYKNVKRLQEEELEPLERAELIEWCEKAIEHINNIFEDQKDTLSDDVKESFLDELGYMKEQLEKAKNLKSENEAIAEPEQSPIPESEPTPEPEQEPEPTPELAPVDVTALFNQGLETSEEPEETEAPAFEAENSSEQEEETSEPEVSSQEETDTPALETEDSSSDEATEEETNDAEPEVTEETPEQSYVINDQTTSNDKDTANLDDLTGFTTYSEYLTAYRQARIDQKDADRFYTDYISGNLPSDLLDEKTFREERQRMLDEIEHRKLEAERAETEKRLREAEERHATASEEREELKTRLEARDAQLSASRKDNVDLRKQLVDRDRTIEGQSRDIADLRGQLEKSQEVAREAQAAQYDAVEAFHRLEKEIAKDRKRVAELERELANTKEEAAEAKEELRQTNERIAENTEAALKQINSLRTENDSDIEKAALDWKAKRISEGEKPKSHKKGPKHMKEVDDQADSIEEAVAPVEETPEETRTIPSSVDIDAGVKESMEMTDRDKKDAPHPLQSEIDAAKAWGSEHNQEYSEQASEELQSGEEYDGGMSL